MRIGLHGFGRVGMVFTKLVSEQDNGIELVINDIEPLNRKIVAYNELYGTESHAQESDGSLKINEKKFEWIQTARETPFSKIPWQGLDCIIEAAIVATVDQLREHTNNARFVVITGTPKTDDFLGDKRFFTYIEGLPDEPSYNIVSFSSDRCQVAGPALIILKELYGVKNLYLTTIRESYSWVYQDRIGRLGGLVRAMPDYNGKIHQTVIFDPNYKIALMILSYDSDGNPEDVIKRVYQRFPGVFNRDCDPVVDMKATIEPVERRVSDLVAFKIRYHSFTLYTKILYDFILGRK